MENNSPSPTSRESAIVLAPNGFRPGVTILVALALLFILAIFTFIPLSWYFATHNLDVAGFKRAAMGWFGIAVQSIAEIACIAFLFAVLPAISKTTLYGLGFRKLRSGDIAVAAYGAIAMILVVNIFATILSKALHDKSQEAAVQVFFNLHSPLQKLGFALFGAVLAPLFEELTFRVFLFNAMRTWWRFWPAAIVSSLLFGIVHFQGGGLSGLLVLMIPLALAGIVLCWVYARTSNAWTSMITHGLANGVTIILLWVAPQLTR